MARGGDYFEYKYSGPSETSVFNHLIDYKYYTSVTLKPSQSFYVRQNDLKRANDKFEYRIGKAKFEPKYALNMN
jgi:hypothetical protein